jgi:phage tail-like protein
MAVPILAGGAAPPLAFQFGVVFLVKGIIPNPVDTLFQKVSGIGATIETESVMAGGQNGYVQRLPKRIQHDNLVLERGILLASPLNKEVTDAIASFTFAPCNVLVNLLDHTGNPLTSWLFLNAFPVKWSLNDLDANANAVVIERLELAYQQMSKIGL